VDRGLVDCFTVVTSVSLALDQTRSMRGPPAEPLTHRPRRPQMRFGPDESIATIDTGVRGWQRYILPISEWPKGIVDVDA
jgi:hypothetical protein